MECLRLQCNFRRVLIGFQEVLKRKQSPGLPAHHRLEEPYEKTQHEIANASQRQQHRLWVSYTLQWEIGGVHAHGSLRCVLMCKDSESLPPTNSVLKVKDLLYKKESKEKMKGNKRNGRS